MDKINHLEEELVECKFKLENVISANCNKKSLHSKDKTYIFLNLREIVMKSVRLMKVG